MNKWVDRFGNIWDDPPDIGHAGWCHEDYTKHISNEMDELKNKLKMKDYTIHIMILIFFENGIHYHYSPELDIYGYGNTEEDSQLLLTTAINLFLEQSIGDKKLKDELQELHWKFNDIPTPPCFDELTKINEDLVKKILPLKPVLTYKTINLHL